jgi:hypothetical protein
MTLYSNKPLPVPPLTLAESENINPRYIECWQFWRYYPSIAANPNDRAVILVIMYVEIFITGLTVVIGDVKMCGSSHWLILFNIRFISFACELRTELIFFVDQDQFSDLDFISDTHQRQNAQFADKAFYWTNHVLVHY